MNNDDIHNDITKIFYESCVANEVEKVKEYLSIIEHFSIEDYSQVEKEMTIFRGLQIASKYGNKKVVEEMLNYMKGSKNIDYNKNSKAFEDTFLLAALNYQTTIMTLLINKELVSAKPSIIKQIKELIKSQEVRDQIFELFDTTKNKCSADLAVKISSNNMNVADKIHNMRRTEKNNSELPQLNK